MVRVEAGHGPLRYAGGLVGGKWINSISFGRTWHRATGRCRTSTPVTNSGKSSFPLSNRGWSDRTLKSEEDSHKPSPPECD